MTTAGVVLARVSLVILGLLLVLGGIVVAAWSWGLIDEVVGSPPERIDAGPVTQATEQAWWPWALAAAGVLLVVVALAWIVAAIPRRTTSTLELTGSGSDGRLSADAQALAGRAAAQAQAELDGDASSGRLVHDKNRPVIDLEVAVGPECDLGRAGDSAERAIDTLRGVTGRDDVPVRLRLVPARRSSRGPRVQ